MKKLLAIICIIAYLIPVYGQNGTLVNNDTLAKYGIYSEYDNASYNTKLGAKIDKSDLILGDLDKATKNTGLTYKAPAQYFISERFSLKSPPDNPKELRRTAGTSFTSKWIHEDGECILFIKCHGMIARINKSKDEIPQTTFDWIKYTTGVGDYFNVKSTDKEMQEIKKKINIWSPEKAKKTFNAQHVITYPIEEEKAVYMGKYTHKLELIMIKWGENLTVSFLVTEKGNKNIDKYIKDVEGAFWFED